MPQMPQYNQPYMPPNAMPYYGAPASPLRHAKRASLLMLIIGPLMLICGLCAGLVPTMISAMPADDSRQFLDQMQTTYRMAPGDILSKALVSGVLVVLAGVALTVLGVVVRRGGRVSAILAMVMTGLILLNLVLGMLVSIAGFEGGGALAFLMQFMMTAVFGLLMYFLIQTARASSTIKQAQLQYQAQYWQYQQNMHAYMQYGQQMPQQGVMGYPPGYAPTAGYSLQNQIPPGYTPSQGYAQAPVPPPPVDPPAP